MRPNTNTGIRGRPSFVLIDCERNGQYKFRKKDFVRRDVKKITKAIKKTFWKLRDSLQRDLFIKNLLYN